MKADTNYTDKQSLARHKQRVWKKYNAWRKNPIMCPALKCSIHATLKGWKHISGEGKARSLLDTHRRLRLIEHAIAIIEKSATIQDISSLKNRTHYALESVEMLREESGRVYKKIRVIIEEQPNGKRVFLSVMDRNIRG